MTRLSFFSVFVIACIGLRGPDPAAQAIQGELYSRPGPFGVETAEYTWRDSTRLRNVPVKIYMPRGKGPFPVIIFSHGLGSSKDGYEYLGRHWASHGYVSVHPTHYGSDASIVKPGERPFESMARAADDPQSAINRPKDVSFVIDELTSMTLHETPLRNRLALDKIGVAGHSFGAYTVLAVAGQTFIGPLGRAFTLGDRRVKAAVAMSTPANRRASEKAYESIRIPCLHITGTRDESPIGTSTAADRRIPFDNMFVADNYLLILNGGDHMIFSGRRFAPELRKRDERFHELILASSTAFWDAYLRDDEMARSWLADGEFEEDIVGEATFEKKFAAGEAVTTSTLQLKN
ncbi:hypothetical protein LLG95_07505 [bacterium]|nr:hypothetical protein [bacterium]